MKLKISESELRVRLSRAEIEQLAREGRLEQSTAIMPDRRLTVVLEADARAERLTLDWKGDRLVVRMPASDAAHWARSGQVGFAEKLGHGLSLRLEWDFKDGQRRERVPPRREEEPDEAPREARDEPSD